MVYMAVAEISAQPPLHQSPQFPWLVIPHLGLGAPSATWIYPSFPSVRSPSDFYAAIAAPVLVGASSISFLLPWKKMA